MGHQCEPSLKRLVAMKAELEAEKPEDMVQKLFAINAQIRRKEKEVKAEPKVEEDAKEEAAAE